MKHVIALAAAAVALAGCQKSLDQQFSDMCAEQKNDPKAPQIGSEQCQNPGAVDEATKKLVVDMYQRQRGRLEASR